MRNRFKAVFVATILVLSFVIFYHIGELLSVEDAAFSKAAFGNEAAENGTDFESLLEEVLTNNPELNFYEAEILAAKGQRKTAGLWNNPEISGSIGRKRAVSGSETSKGVASEIVVTQSIEWPGRIRLRKAVADRDIKLAELELEQFRALLKARTHIAAYTLSALQERAEATQEVAEHFRAMREVLLQRDQAGLTPMLEARIIEAIEINMQRKASRASLEAKAALLDLNQLRGADPDAAFILSRMNPDFRPLGIDKNKLKEFAAANDYEVRLRAIELERQGYEVKLAKNERFPDITAGPAIGWERAGERERVIGASISLPLPLWDRNQGNITTAKASQIQAETSFELAQRNAERRVIEAIATYETKLEEMSNWKPDSIQHFKEAAELADRHYRLGAVPVSTYIELQSQYLETLEGLQETKKEALETAAQLELMTGADLSLIQIGKGDTQ